MGVIAFDTETELIGNRKNGQYQIVPKLICASFAWEDKKLLLGNGDDPELYDKIEEIFSNDDVVTGVNIAFDCAVVCRAFPNLYSTIFEKYEKGLIKDLSIRQKLIDLSSSGQIENKSYSLNNLGISYGLHDRSEDKKDPNSVRLRFSELDGMRAIDYPEVFYNYAIEDADSSLYIYEQQENTEFSTVTDAFHSAAAFCFQLITAEGMKTDLDRVEKLKKLLESKLSNELMLPLVEAGILRPATPPRPKKIGDGYIKGKAESVNKKALQNYVLDAFSRRGLEVPRTEPSKTYPSGQIKTDVSALTKIAKKDSTINLYLERQKLNKLKTTYLPNLEKGICFFGFNPLVSTGRASSVSSKLYPSMNGQNQPRETGALSIRECFVPREGNLFLAIDVSALELCSVAQQTYNLFGRSVHRDKINAGYDLHAYLGSQIALRWDKAFRDSCQDSGLSSSDEIYKLFLELKKTDSTFFKRFRTLAKPTGLGYPGGLGPRKFVDFCFSGYGLDITFKDAQELRDMWFRTYPEMREYFNWVNTQTDDRNIGLFKYVSPLGMLRRGAVYTAAANGFALQTPSAEAVKIALFRLVRACYDYTIDSPMYGCRIVNEIHDEIIWEIPDDDLRNDRVLWCQKIFQDSLSEIFPDVTMRTEAVLMNRWYKQAEPTYSPEGELTIWKK